jgi:protein TonB
LKDQNISNTTTEGEDGDLGPVEQTYTPVEEAPKVEEVVAYAEQMPTYPGGEEAMRADLAKAITYPEMEKENNVQGTVYVSFIVEKDGAINDVKVMREVNGGPNLTKEAVKAVNKLKKWEPGKMNGKSVRVRMNIPVKFVLR